MSDECGIGATALGIRPRTTPTCRSRRQVLGNCCHLTHSSKRPLLNNTEAAGFKQFWHLKPGLPRDVVASVLYSYHLLHGFGVSAVADWKTEALV